MNLNKRISNVKYEQFYILLKIHITKKKNPKNTARNANAICNFGENERLALCFAIILMGLCKNNLLTSSERLQGLYCNLRQL